MTGEDGECRLTVRRGGYLMVLITAAVIGCAVVVWAALVQPVVPLAVVVVAWSAATVIGCRKVLTGPRTITATSDGVFGDDAAGMLPFTGGMVVKQVGKRMRAVGMADGRTWLWLPRWVAGDRTRFAATVMAGIRRTLPLAYASSSKRLAERSLLLPASLSEVCRRNESVAGNESLVFTVAPRPPRWSSASWFFLLLLVLSVVGLAVGTSSAVPFLSVMIGLAVLVLALLLLVSGRRGKGLWLFIDDDGLALIRSDLSGELAWSEVLEITGVQPGFLAPKRSSGPVAAQARLRTTDQTDILLADVFDAPLVCIVEDMQVRRRLAASPGGSGG